MYGLCNTKYGYEKDGTQAYCEFAFDLEISHPIPLLVPFLLELPQVLFFERCKNRLQIPWHSWLAEGALTPRAAHWWAMYNHYDYDGALHETVL